MIQQPPPVVSADLPVPRAVHLGAVAMPVPVLLAPMAGVTDQPFRRLIKQFGASLMFSEMIASEALVRDSRKTRHMLERTPEEEPLAVQIAGCDPDVMARAAAENEQDGAPLIDINFGCPVKKIVNGQAGAAVMRDPDLARRIVASVVRVVRVPVTVKMRLGWTHDTINAPDIARIAAGEGAQMVTVHGRTRSQFYEGTADWTRVRDVKNAVSIPVIVNGDIKDPASMTQALTQSGADGVMIGRAVYGKPWLIGQQMHYWQTGAMPAPLPRAALKDTVLRHFDSMLAHYGAYAGLRIARKHLGWYSKAWPHAALFRASVNHMDDAAAARDAIAAFFDAAVWDEQQGQAG